MYQDCLFLSNIFQSFSSVCKLKNKSQKPNSSLKTLLPFFSFSPSCKYYMKILVIY